VQDMEVNLYIDEDDEDTEDSSDDEDMEV
jgi:hypothetical protein